jgi:hypothetical protein
LRRTLIATRTTASVTAVSGQTQGDRINLKVLPSL